jgi:hypothetical protein
MTYIGYSFEAGRFETTSLEKYLHVQEKIITHEQLKTLVVEESQEPVIIIASHLNAYSEILDSATRKIILIHLSDEAYDVRKCKLYLHPQVLLIVRNNEVFTCNFLFTHALKWPYWFMKWVIAYWISERSLSENLKTVRHLFLSRRYLIRQIRMALLVRKTNAQVICFPLNETNFYVQGDSPEIVEKTIDVSFAGTTHSAERVVASRVAHQLGYSHGYDGEWGPGGKGSLSPKEYVNLLKSSHFCLCPNGHVNQDCFRFYEIIAAGSLPLIPKGTPYQPFGYYANIYDVDPRLMVSSYNVDSVKKQMKNIPIEERNQILQKLKQSIAQKNTIAKSIIQECFNSKVRSID